MHNDKIGVVGLGYVGLSLVAALARVGYNVVGIDIDKKRIRRFQNTYEPDIYEPGLSETLKQCKTSIEFTSEYGVFAEKCDAIMITVGTPVDGHGRPRHEHLHRAVLNIGKRLRKGHIIVLKSTVALGTTERVARKLEKLSGLKAGIDFYVGFCPERTIEGLALHELYTLPKIIGGINEESSRGIARVIEKLGGKVIVVSSPAVAELCKLTDNMYRALNIAFANELGCLCEETGIDSHEVVSAVNDAYHRTHIYKPGLGADGPCLGKDSLMISYSAKKAGVPFPVVNASIEANRASTCRIVKIVSGWLKENKILIPRISFVGLAFKGFPETDDMRGSPARIIYAELKRKHRRMRASCYDPIVKEFFGLSVSKNLRDCLKGSHVVIFLTNHPSLMRIDAEGVLADTGRPLLVVDCWHSVTNSGLFSRGSDTTIFKIGDGNK